MVDANFLNHTDTVMKYLHKQCATDLYVVLATKLSTMNLTVTNNLNTYDKLTYIINKLSNKLQNCQRIVSIFTYIPTNYYYYALVNNSNTGFSKYKVQD